MELQRQDLWIPVPFMGKGWGGGGGGPLFLASMASLEHHSFFGHYVKQNVGLSNPFGLIQQDCYIGHMKQSYTEPDFWLISQYCLFCSIFYSDIFSLDKVSLKQRFFIAPTNWKPVCGGVMDWTWDFLLTRLLAGYITRAVVLFNPIPLRWYHM